MKAYATSISMFLHQSQITVKHFIHGNLDRTC